MVDYTGVGEGSVTIGCDAAGARSLAANFLGQDSPDDSQVTAFLGELANMVCGAVVSTFDGEGNYLLGSPRLVPPEDMAIQDGVRCDFEIDGGFLSVVAREKAHT